MKKCTNCGRTESNNSTVCTVCGGALIKEETEIRCPVCGTPVAADYVNCPSCGGVNPAINTAPVITEAPPAQPTEAEIVAVPDEKPQKSGKSIVILLTVLITLLVTAIIAGVVLLIDGSDDSASEEETAISDSTAEKPETETAEETEDTEPDVEAEEKAVKKVMSDYEEAWFSGNDKALDYVEEGSEVYEVTETILEMFHSYDDWGKALEMTGDMADKADAIADDYVEEMQSMYDLEIKSVKVDGDTATVKIVLSYPDLEACEEEWDSISLEKTMEENYTEEEIAKFDAASEEEQDKILLNVMELCFDEMLDVLEKSCTEVKGTYTLEKTDGKWIITESD